LAGWLVVGLFVCLVHEWASSAFEVKWICLGGWAMGWVGGTAGVHCSFRPWLQRARSAEPIGYKQRIHPERMASTGRQRGWIPPPLAPVESDADAPAEIKMAEMYDVMNMSLPSEPLQFQDEHGLPAFTRPPYQPVRHAGRYHSHCWRNQESTIK
jgi:hypothetical protein